MTTTVLAEESGSRAGHGHLSLSYQYISVDGFESSVGKLPIGTVDTHSINVDIEYNATDRLTLVAGIPYVIKRYKGPGQHDPLALDPPRTDVQNVDQGDWNNSLQDFHLGVRYRLREGIYLVEPYAFLGVPSHSYPHFGHAAVGQNLVKFDIGTTLGWFPGLSDAYYRVDIGYVFVEETLGVNIDHWKITGEAGYFFSNRLTGRIFAQLKDGGGEVFPDDFPPPRTDDRWYQHDRMVKHNYLNVGVGLDWAMNESYSFNTSVMTQAWAEQVHVMEYAIIAGVGWAF